MILDPAHTGHTRHLIPPPRPPRGMEIFVLIAAPREPTIV